MPDEVQIKQFELSDEQALLSFLRHAYPDDPRKSDPAFWKWHYLENPYTSVDNVPLWVVKKGNEVVGQLATIPVELKVGKETTRAIWILDFIVDQNYRGALNRIEILRRDRFRFQFARRVQTLQSSLG